MYTFHFSTYCDTAAVHFTRGVSHPALLSPSSPGPVPAQDCQYPQQTPLLYPYHGPSQSPALKFLLRLLILRISAYSCLVQVGVNPFLKYSPWGLFWEMIYRFVFSCFQILCVLQSALGDSKSQSCRGVKLQIQHKSCLAHWHLP